MKNIMSIIKKHPCITVMIILAIFSVPLLIVHVLFKMKTETEFLVAEWTAGELLGYISSTLSFLGTILLGIMAFNSSENANALSKRITDLEQDRYKLDLRPFVLLTNWKAYVLTQQEIQYSPKKKYIQIGEFNAQELLGLSLTLTNTTNSYISVKYLTGQSNGEKWKNSAVNQSNLKMSLAPNESDEFIFYATKDDLKRLTSSAVDIEFFLENRFSQRYKEKFTIIIASLTYLPTFSKTEWFCQIYAQNYSIMRYSEDENGEVISIHENL